MEKSNECYNLMHLKSDLSIQALLSTPQLRPYLEEMPIENLVCKPYEFEVKRMF